MNKEKLWIVSFQHKSRDGIKTRATCVESRNIAGALAVAQERIRKYMPDECAYVITDIGIAEEGNRERLGAIWKDPINEPDEELFR